MNYEAAREWIDSQIDRLLDDLKELQDNAEYDEPGIFYEQVREGERINREIQDLIHQLEDMDEGV